MTDTKFSHDWIPSTLGHGEVMCRFCLITNREAAALGKLNECDATANDRAALSRARGEV